MVEPYPSEKWWSSSVGTMTFPISMGKKSSEPPTSNRHIKFLIKYLSAYLSLNPSYPQNAWYPNFVHSSNWPPIKTILPQIIMSWFGDGSKPSLDTFGGWASINPSCFRVHRKGFDQPNTWWPHRLRRFARASSNPARKFEGLKWRYHLKLEISTGLRLVMVT